MNQTKTFRARWQGRGGDWHGWQDVQAETIEEARQKIATSELCGDATTVEIREAR